MSKEYDLYLYKHRQNVATGFRWIRENMPELLINISGVDYEHQICYAHDLSKDKSDEYLAYDAYFYGNNRSYNVVRDFKYAWLKHIHRNPHHWQHWILNDDDEPREGENIMDMPYNYIVEMICDWWSFSWYTGNLYDIFRWYDAKKDHIKLSDTTRLTVERILTDIKEKLILNNSQERLEENKND